MRDVNKIDIGNIQNASFQKEKAEKSEPQVCLGNEEPSIKDFSNPTEILGRSQVNAADNVVSDIAFCSEHPEVVEKSEKLFDIAYQGLLADNDPEAYEKACSIATSSEAKDILS